MSYKAMETEEPSMHINDSKSESQSEKTTYYTTPTI